MQITEPIKAHKKLILILIGTLVLLGGITYSFVSPYGIFTGLKNDLKTIDPDTESSYTDLDGNPVDLKSFKGKPLIINSWASWMPFSQTELPLLAKIKSEKGNSLHILAINRMENTAMIKSFLSAYTIGTDTLVFLADPTDHFYSAIEGYAMPETVFYDSTGTLLIHKRGSLTEDELRGYVEALLSAE
jgi:thiol-disulfide isomerase/thioredoxin